MRPTKSIVSDVAVRGGRARGLFDQRRVAQAQRFDLALDLVVAHEHDRLAARQTLERGQLDRRPHLDQRLVAELAIGLRRRRVDRGRRDRLDARLRERRAERLVHEHALDLLAERGAVHPLEHRRAAPCPGGSP